MAWQLFWDMVSFSRLFVISNVANKIKEIAHVGQLLFTSIDS